MEFAEIDFGDFADSIPTPQTANARTLSSKISVLRRGFEAVGVDDHGEGLGAHLFGSAP